MTDPKRDHMAAKVACCCGWRGHQWQLLAAKSPFDPADTLHACPDCRDPTESRYICCEEDGCWNEVTEGTPYDNKRLYKFHCYQHPPA